MVNIYKFETDYCPMCKVAGRMIKEQGLNVIPVDAELHEDLVELYDIHSVPCLVVARELGEDALAMCRTPQSKEHLEMFVNNLDLVEQIDKIREEDGHDT